jgi:hypothetical protein
MLATILNHRTNETLHTVRILYVVTWASDKRFTFNDVPLTWRMPIEAFSDYDFLRDGDVVTLKAPTIQYQALCQIRRNKNKLPRIYLKHIQDRFELVRHLSKQGERK